MKKLLFITALISWALIFSNCSKKDDTTTNDNKDTTNNTTGTYNATGTVTFKAGGVDHSCSISTVIIYSTSLTIQTLSTDVNTNGVIIISCYTATSAVTTGTYTADGITAISAVSYMYNSIDMYSATATKSGSNCTVNITTLTSTSIKGTFSGILAPPLSGTNIDITNGVINCTIGSKRSK
jgi:PBP1b-binding outer membrane lipoprotein LpoB